MTSTEPSVSRSVLEKILGGLSCLLLALSVFGLLLFLVWGGGTFTLAGKEISLQSTEGPLVLGFWGSVLLIPLLFAGSGAGLCVQGDSSRGSSLLDATLLGGFFCLREFLLHRSGFVFFSPDDACRLVMGMGWSRSPWLEANAVWLPPHQWLLGSLYWFIPEVLLVGKLITLAFSLMLLVSLYLLANHLFGRKVALLSGGLFVVWTPVLWLGAAPMAEMFTFGPWMACVYFALRFEKEPLWRWGVGMGLAGLTATLFRYDGWFLALCLLVIAVYRLVKSNPRLAWRKAWLYAVPCLFPAFYTFHNWSTTGDPFGFVDNAELIFSSFRPETFAQRWDDWIDLFDGPSWLILPLGLAAWWATARAGILPGSYGLLGFGPFLIWSFYYLAKGGAAATNYPPRQALSVLLFLFPLWAWAVHRLGKGHSLLPSGLLLVAVILANSCDQWIAGPPPHQFMEKEAEQVGAFIAREWKERSEPGVLILEDESTDRDLYVHLEVSALIGFRGQVLRRSEITDPPSQETERKAWRLERREGREPSGETIWEGEIFRVYRPIVASASD